MKEKIVVIENNGGDAEVRYAGRTIQIVVIVNTSEDAESLNRRVCEYIKDSGCQPMVVGSGAEMNPEDSGPVWEELLGLVNLQKAPPPNGALDTFCRVAKTWRT